MPAIVLGRHPARSYDIIGSITDHAVTHVGLLAGDVEVEYDHAVDVFDMGPPLSVETPSPMNAHAVGWLELTIDERDGLADWLQEMKTLAYCFYKPARLKRV